MHTWRAEPGEVFERAIRALDGESRPGQQRLSAAVVGAIASRRHLVAEAPTGSGKSLAYLAPAIASGLRVVVSTGTLALQDQLVRKDLPALAESGGVTFRAAVLKGRSNYVCLAKLDAARRPDVLFDVAPGPRFDAELASVERFAEASENGDRSDLGLVSNATWAAVSCGADECPGASKCDFGDDCFAERARKGAADADVLVVNHSLYCMHVASGGQFLPEHDLLIVDEAHALRNAATGAFGVEVTPLGLRQLASRCTRAGVDRELGDGIARGADALEGALDDLDGRVAADEEHLAAAIATCAERIASSAAKIPRPSENGGDSTQRTRRLAASRLDAIRRVQSATDDDVLWVERGRRGHRALRLAPIVVGEFLADGLFAKTPSVLVSATLGGAEPFAAFARGVGLDPAAVVIGAADEEGAGADTDDAPGLGYVALRVESPFDWRTQALLYVPPALPEVRDDGWQDAAAQELCALVDAAGGRTLVLCTSHRNVERFTRMLRERTDHRILSQEDGAKATLTREFLHDETSCLVGTRSFWEGIDVPGGSCILVVIDKLPFAAPGDAIAQARRDRATRNGGDWFADVDLPAAALTLAQGAGRLLRRREDRGVVAVLDRRLARARYRAALLDALPPMRRCVDRDEVTAFLADAARTVAAHTADTVTDVVTDEAAEPALDG